MSKENLYNREAVKKLQELGNKIDISMLCTNSQDVGHIHAVPMSRQEIDDDGNIWFIYSAKSETFNHLKKDNSVCLLFSDPSNFSFISIHANSQTNRDRERIEKYWNKMMDGWFEKGKEDPDIRILKVMPIEAHYWDTKSNKLVTFLKAAANGITGSKMEIGREGDLNI